MVIVAPWVVTLSGGAGGAVSPEVAGAMLSSPAKKLLVLLPEEGWNWTGLNRWNFDAGVRQTMNAVKQVLAGEEVNEHRPLGAGAIVGIVLGILFLLILLTLAINNYL